MSERLRRTMKWSALAGALALIACEGEADTHFPTPVASDGAPIMRTVVDVGASRDAVDASVSMGPDAAADGGADAMTDVAAPTTITMVIDNPIKDSVIQARGRFQPSVSVTVEAAEPGGGNAVASVNGTLIDLATKMQVGALLLGKTKVENVPESTAVIYRFGETPLDISGLSSGSYEMTFVAKTSSGLEQRATVSFVVDAGPVIVVVEPAEGKPYRFGTDVDVTVTDKLFGPVTDVTLAVGQTPLTGVLPVSAGSERRKGHIDFMKYSPPLEGELLLTVRAKNSKGTETVLLRKFLADRTGPTMKNTVPGSGALVGRVISIEAEISDPSGVIPSSVIAVIGHGDNKFERKLEPPAAGAKEPVYKALFDTTVLPVNALFPSISFRASDELGNESSVGYLLSLDNTPPLADLDPPDDLRMQSELDRTPTSLSCSWPIDPVGPDAVDDGALVAQLFDVRARIEDQGNDPKSGSADFTPISGVPEGQAKLLVLDDTRLPLVVDSDGDGKCDRVNPTLTPTTVPMSARDALAIDMIPIPPKGSYDLTYDSSIACSARQTSIPAPVCQTTANDAKVRYDSFDQAHSYAMTAYLSYAGKLPAIWTVPPIVEDNLQCAGRQFDSFANHISDGWACLAIAVSDSLGNAQVSRVLRVCIDHDGNGAECTSHRRLAQVTAGPPTIVETVADHGVPDGAEVIVGDALGANGRWTVQKLDDRRLALLGSTSTNVAPPMTGRLVPVADMPNCTGTVTRLLPTPEVTAGTACTPWRNYPRGEFRRIQ